MFLKVKRAASKQYFALCESVRRDKKIVTKTIRSLGNEEKALLLLQSDYPEFLDRFYEIVGTKKCRDNSVVSLAHNGIRDLCIQHGFEHLINSDTLINLYSFDKEMKLRAASQASLYLHNDFGISQVTIRKYFTGEVKVYVDSDSYKKGSFLYNETKKSYFTRYDDYGYLPLCGDRECYANDFVDTFSC